MLTLAKVKEWDEGACDCSERCLLDIDEFSPCCPDYVEECHILVDESSSGGMIQRLIDYLGITWFHLAAIALASLVILFALSVVLVKYCSFGRRHRHRRTKIRRRRRQRHPGGRFDQDSLMEDEDDQGMTSPAAGANTVSVDELYPIDFSLATPRSVEDTINQLEMENRLRQITSSI